MKITNYFIFLFITFTTLAQEEGFSEFNRENDTIKRVSVNPMYFEIQNESGTIDLYFGNTLIASDLDGRLQLDDILLETNLIIIRREEKVGVIDQTGTIIVPIEYGAIEAISSFTYQLNDSILLDYLLILDKSDYFYSPEDNGFYRLGTPVLYLAKGDATLLSDSIFSEAVFDSEKNELFLIHENKIASMNDQCQIKYSPYEEIVDFMDWKICSTGKETIIFNRFGVAIDTFQGVIIPVRRISEATNHGGMIEMLEYDEPISEEFVYVTRNEDGNQIRAIYDLKNRKIVSRWGQKITFVSKGVTSSGVIVWVSKMDSESLDYSFSTGSERVGYYDYKEIYQVSDQFFVLKKKGESVFTLCEIVGDSVFVERAQIEKSFGSLNYSGLNTSSIQEFDPKLTNGFVDEFGNYYSYSLDTEQVVLSLITTPFTMFKNVNGKLGFIAWNGTVLDLNADTLFQSDKSSNLIEYRVGNLWGAAEIVWGSNFKPDQSEVGRFYLLEDVFVIYRLGDDERNYVDGKGRSFLSLNTERSISKKGKYQGAEVYSDFGTENGENTKEVVIPFIYSKLIQSWNYIHFSAQGSTKKWGIISVFNDTVFPFVYDRIEFGKAGFPMGFFPFRDFDQQCFTTIGKFRGLLSLDLKKEIPAVYDRVHYIPDAAFIVKKGEKYGVYDYNLNEKVKPVFNEVFIAAYEIGVYILRARKDQKWYNKQFFEGEVPDQTLLLQTPACDLVINEFGFVKKETGYEIVSLTEQLIVEDKSDPMTHLNEKQFKLMDGKIYIMNAKEKLLYPEGFTNIVFQGEDQITTVIEGIQYSYCLSKKRKIRVFD